MINTVNEIPNETQTEKAILSLRVAQSLMESGYKLIRIEHSHKHRNKLAFIFEYYEGLDDELAKFTRNRPYYRNGGGSRERGNRTDIVPHLVQSSGVKNPSAEVQQGRTNGQI